MDTKQKIAIVAAIGENNEIGKNNTLIWSIKADMQFFIKITLGFFVIMGRKTYESIPLRFRPLIDRINTVITRTQKFPGENIIIVDSLAAGIAKGRDQKKIFIIGGSQVYTHALDMDIVDELWLTQISASDPDADSYFPEYKEKFHLSKWSRKQFDEKTGLHFQFQLWTRNKPNFYKKMWEYLFPSLN